MIDPRHPSIALLCKLGSIMVHAEELVSSDGHAFDREAMRTLTFDPEVVEWRKAMDAMALLPVKRRKE